MELKQSILTLAQAASYLQVTEAELMQLVVSGDLRGAVLYGTMRFHRDDLDQFLKGLAEWYQAAMTTRPVTAGTVVSATGNGLEATAQPKAVPGPARRRRSRTPAGRRARVAFSRRRFR